MAFVAQTNAEIVRAASQDAFDEILHLERILAALLSTTDTDLTEASDASAQARHAFLQIESAVYYPIPEVPAWSQPFNGFSPKQLSPEPPVFVTVRRLLAEYPSIPLDSLSLPNSRSLALENLKAETSILRVALKDFLATWSTAPADNFRNQDVLADSSGAVGRIFHGLLTVTDLMILEGPSSFDRDRVAARLEGVRSIYEGSYAPRKSTRISGPGLVTLLQKSDPALAQSLTTTIDDLLEDWKGEPAGSDDSAPLLSLKAKIIDAAEALGFSAQTSSESTP